MERGLQGGIIDVSYLKPRSERARDRREILETLPQRGRPEAALPPFEQPREEGEEGRDNRPDGVFHPLEGRQWDSMSRVN